MGEKIKYINEKYNKDKTEIIAYCVCIVAPHKSPLKGIHKYFSTTKHVNALEKALEYLNTNEDCQRLVKECQLVAKNKSKILSKDCYEKIPSRDTNEKNIYKLFRKTKYGYKHIGYFLSYRLGDIQFQKSFCFATHDDAFKSAIEFRDTDKETVKNFSMQKNKKFSDDDMKIKNAMSKYGIEKFPIKINGIKYIGIDRINDKFCLIKECECCKTHVNIALYMRKSGSPFCVSCAWSTTKKAKFYTTTHSKDAKGNLVYKITSQITVGKLKDIKYLIRFNIILNIRNYTNEKEFNDAKEINILYAQYLLDCFIKKHKLKYPAILDKNIFSNFKNKTIPNYCLTKYPNHIFIDNDALKIPLVRKQQHIFKAKIQGFGTNKKDESKMVVLEEVEYIGIDNFRDHMWTTLSKQLDLPVGTTIKFKGEIYDYEREYLGTKEVDKNGQSIKIIELLEVDRSTRERVKLYK